MRRAFECCCTNCDSKSPFLSLVSTANTELFGDKLCCCGGEEACQRDEIKLAEHVQSLAAQTGLSNKQRLHNCYENAFAAIHYAGVAVFSVLRWYIVMCDCVGPRTALPVCIVTYIREQFPDDAFTGFKPN